MNYRDKINLNNVVKWRNHIHENPELSFEEVKTSQYVYDILESFENIELNRLTKTSVIGMLDTGKPGKTIALRADMDALPMQEETDGIEYKSKVANVMHSCGHDTHTAMLLGAAEVISQLVKDGKLSGKIKFIFQHAEETPPGGAVDLVAAGVMDDVDEVYGIHVGGGFPVGIIGSVHEYMTAASDTFELTLKGLGSHGSTPEKAIDLVSVGAQIVNSLQTIVSRNIGALDKAVITVGQFNIGTAPNIIADNGYLSGTVRTLNAETRDFVAERIEKIIDALCVANDVKYELKYDRGYSSVYNTDEQFNVVKNAAEKIEGTQFMVFDPLMGSEDFSAYTEVKPGCFTFIGAGGKYYNHHPEFFVDEKALEIGTALHIQIIEDILG